MNDSRLPPPETANGRLFLLTPSGRCICTDQPTCAHYRPFRFVIAEVDRTGPMLRTGTDGSRRPMTLVERNISSYVFDSHGQNSAVHNAGARNSIPMREGSERWHFDRDIGSYADPNDHTLQYVTRITGDATVLLFGFDNVTVWLWCGGPHRSRFPSVDVRPGDSHPILWLLLQLTEPDRRGFNDTILQLKPEWFCRRGRQRGLPTIVIAPESLSWNTKYTVPTMDVEYATSRRLPPIEPTKRLRVLPPPPPPPPQWMLRHVQERGRDAAAEQKIRDESPPPNNRDWLSFFAEEMLNRW